MLGVEESLGKNIDFPLSMIRAESDGSESARF